MKKSFEYLFSWEQYYARLRRFSLDRSWGIFSTSDNLASTDTQLLTVKIHALPSQASNVTPMNAGAKRVLFEVQVNDEPKSKHTFRNSTYWTAFQKDKLPFTLNPELFYRHGQRSILLSGIKDLNALLETNPIYFSDTYFQAHLC